MKKAAFIVAFGAIFLFGSMNAVSAETDYTGIDRNLERQMKQAGIPNMSLGIVKDGEMLYLQTYGDNTEYPNNTNRVYPISSLSKAFTALAARQLISAGTLNENAPVEQYLPDFMSTYQGKPATISVGQLIRHISGISKATGGQPYTYNTRYSLADVAQKSMRIQLTNAPGKTYEYSNMNYILLGHIIEIVAEMPFEEYVGENILKPLKMSNTYPKASRLGYIEPAQGHIPFYGLALPLSNSLTIGEAPTSSGGFLSTAEDMCRFMICYQQGGNVGEVSLIEKNSVLGWNSAQPDEYYDIYWTKTKREPGIQFFHSGSQPGYSSSIRMDVDSGYGIVILANSFDQIGMQTDMPTPWNMTEDVLAYLTTGQFPDPVKVSYDYLLIVRMGCLLAGLLAFIMWMFRRAMRNSHNQRSIRRELLLVTVCFGLPFLWVILLPVLNDCSWEWLLISNPIVNISLLCIMAALVLTGAGKGVAVAARLLSLHYN